MTLRKLWILAAPVGALLLSACHVPWIDNPVPGLAGSEVSGRCTQYEHLLEANGLPVDQFSRIMYRESRCNPGARNSSSGAAGLLQIMPQWITRWNGCTDTMREYNACMVASLFDAGWNIHMAKRIYTLQGTNAWAQTR